MKKWKLFPKLFLSSFSLLLVLILLIHLMVYLLFPRTYLESRKREVEGAANELAQSLQGRSLDFVQKSLDLYSRSNKLRAFISEQKEGNAVPLEAPPGADWQSRNNSLVLEARRIRLDTGAECSITLLSTTDMQADAKHLSLRFLPYTLALSLLASALLSFLYARFSCAYLRAIQRVMERMQALDRTAFLPVRTEDELGAFQRQINALYGDLLALIDDLDQKNQEIVLLEERKQNFLRASSHELKTPLSSLQIILENMKYKVGQYQDRDYYIDRSLALVEDLSARIRQMLLPSSFDDFEDPPTWLALGPALSPVLENYQVLIKKRKLRLDVKVGEERVWMSREALGMVLSNLISNAVRYADEGGEIEIWAESGGLTIRNTYQAGATSAGPGDGTRMEAGSGLGLSLVRSILEASGLTFSWRAEEGKVLASFGPQEGRASNEEKKADH